MDPQEHARKQYDAFLRSKRAPALAILDLEKRLGKKQWPFVVFGGAARDIWLAGSSAEPRDLDIVVDTTKDIRAAFPELGILNQFGGIRGTLHGIPVDVWPLHQHWQFVQQEAKQRTFQDLVRSTTFNLEGLAMEPTLDVKFYEGGFLECMASRKLELVSSSIPFPKLNVARALSFCVRFQLEPGPRLQEFLRSCPEKPRAVLSILQHQGLGAQDISEDLVRQYLAQRQ